MNVIEAWMVPALLASSGTIVVYLLALRANAKVKWLHPLALTSGSIMIFLLVAQIPYETYAKGGDLLAYLLGPATVALAVPIYKQRQVILRQFWAILGSISVGSIAGIATSWALVVAFHGSHELWIAIMPKSATAAISYPLAEAMGGPGELAAVLTVLTGLLGSILGPPLLRAMGVEDSLPLGIAIGTGAHGIGTSKLSRDSLEAGGYSGLAMGITGIVVAILMIPFYLWK